MRIAYIAAGAGGMYCGSCLHDNALAAALMRLGHEVALVPTYTPLKTDEAPVTGKRVFYGALNVYLQQKLGLFRRTPWLLDRLLDRPRLLSWLTRFSASTNARELGELTLSMLQGDEGRQAKELEKLAAWLGEEYRPEVVHITNSMFLGMVRRLKEVLGVPVVVSLQGEDLFLSELAEPYRSRAYEVMRSRAGDADAFVAPSRYYARHMGELLEVEPATIHVVRLGLHLEPFVAGAAGEDEGAVEGGVAAGRVAEGGAPVVAYLGRIAPEKGFGAMVDAFLDLARRPGNEAVLLEAAGWLGAKDKTFFAQQRERLAAAGLDRRFRYHGEVDLAAKLAFLRRATVLSFPTVYREPKGLPVLEALALGVPVVQPAHGSFPELLEATGGGLLVEPRSPAALADGLHTLLHDSGERRRLGEAGRRAVHADFTDEAMARETLAVYAAVGVVPA